MFNQVLAGSRLVDGGRKVGNSSEMVRISLKSVVAWPCTATLCTGSGGKRWRGVQRRAVPRHIGNRLVTPRSCLGACQRSNIYLQDCDFEECSHDELQNKLRFIFD
ncbi:hypothetical protein FA13DRAFT_256929 [Coprinellus micaceus]|uniref:Uncharacterized protein n=1 Tax=Coprinellus micaceus TaxID=71717 RepID=A0A4Y7TET5_COPMI|nr:hypothetical protein FA13DRAFT_256929 [Coprinellus micaceus]